MLDALLGVGSKTPDLGTLQVCLRAVIIFVFALVLLRLADRRFLSDMTPFDVILGIVLGSILSRAINSASPLLPTMAAALLLVGLHRLFGVLSYRWHWFGNLVKGRSIALVEQGQPDRDVLQKLHISDEDLVQVLRTEGEKGDIGAIGLMTLERSGKVSVVAEP